MKDQNSWGWGRPAGLNPPLVCGTEPVSSRMPVVRTRPTRPQLFLSPHSFFIFSYLLFSPSSSSFIGINQPSFWAQYRLKMVSEPNVLLSVLITFVTFGFNEIIQSHKSDLFPQKSFYRHFFPNSGININKTRTWAPRGDQGLFLCLPPLWDEGGEDEQTEKTIISLQERNKQWKWKGLNMTLN